METMIRNEIIRYVQESPDNRFPDTGGPYFTEPLVGFAAGDDPLFAAYKEIIGDFHRTPREILAGAATVISWVLPVTLATRESNRRENYWPSREWSFTRSHGENFNSSLRRHLVAWLEGRGNRAVAPQLDPCWRQLDDPAVGIASTWSERHAAYAAGLGTFSLTVSSPRGGSPTAWGASSPTRSCRQRHAPHPIIATTASGTERGAAASVSAVAR